MTQCRIVYWALGSTGSRPFKSEHHTFKVAPYNEPYNIREWRLANVDDVLDSFDEAKESLNDNEYYLCTLQDGYMGGKGFKYNVSGDVKKQDHKLLVKGKIASAKYNRSVKHTMVKYNRSLRQWRKYSVDENIVGTL